jgi:hypothetical protein
MPSNSPTTKKGKTTGKKKAAKPIGLCAALLWVKTRTNVASRCIMAITHGQKWVVGNAATINGDINNKPLSGHQWYQKGPSSKGFVPGNPDFAGMLWGGRGQL